jgi:large subunit ribosomal protein L28
MAAVCDICGKHPGLGMKVSFSHKRSPRRWNSNADQTAIGGHMVAQLRR